MILFRGSRRMRLHNQVRIVVLSTIIGAGLAQFSSTASAQNFWDGEDNNFWHEPFNWSFDLLPGGASDLAHVEFVQTGAFNFETIDWNGGEDAGIRSMTFNSAAASGVTISGLSSTATATDSQLHFAASTSEGLFDLTGDPNDRNVRIRVLAGDHVISGAKAGGSNYDVSFIGGGNGNPPSIHNWEVAEDSSLTFDATIARAGSGHIEFHKMGDGTVTLGGATNIGQIHYVVDDGTLVFGASGVRGNTGNLITVNDGGTLQLNNVAYGGNNGVLTLNGAGHNGLGAIHATGGIENSVTGTASPSSSTPGEAIGQVIVATDSSIGVEAGSELRWTHGIEASGFGNLTKVGGGTMVFEANNSLPEYGYAGTITVAEGSLLLNSQANTIVMTGDIIVGTSTNNRNITLVSNDDVRVGQPVSGPGVSAGKFVTGVNAVDERVTVNEFLLTETAEETYTFEGISSALNTSPVVVQSGATFGGNGSILNSTVTVDAGGILSPGMSIGTLTAGSTTLNGALQIEFGDDSIDQLMVSGVLDLTNASVDFSSVGTLVNGEYVFATYDTLVGTGFANVLNKPDSLMLHHDETNKWFSLIGEFSEGLAGDHNGDGLVNAADYVLWRDSMSDDIAGYNDWRANFGGMNGSGTTASSVPEPSTIGLMAVALAAVLLHLLRWRL
jgi:autotransporter-associated beta strand protein